MLLHTTISPLNPVTGRHGKTLAEKFKPNALSSTVAHDTHNYKDYIIMYAHSLQFNNNTAWNTEMTQLQYSLGG